jgi:hypothetical protein
MTDNFNAIVPKSTVNKPCRFFFEIGSPKHHFIENAKMRFFPSDYEIATTGDKVIHVDRINEQITVEYEVEVDWSEEYGPTLEWRTKTFYFKKSLAHFLRGQFNKSISLLDEKFESEFNGYKQKYFIGNLVSQLVGAYNVLSENSAFTTYLQECQGPFIGMLHYLYKNYPEYTPPKSPEINGILAKSAFASNLPDEVALSPKLAKSIIDLVYKGEKVFSFTDPDAEIKLKHFIKGQLSNIITPIVFDKNQDATRYFIHRIAELINVRLIDITRNQIFQYKEAALKVSDIYAGASKFRSRKTAKKDAIDKAIELSMI